MVGVGTSAAGDRAFRWTAAGGMVELSVLSGLTSARANGVSEDGSVIVGRSGDRSVRWVGSAIIDLNTFNSGQFSTANAVSANGVQIVGNAFNGNITSPDTIPYRWTLAGGSQTLGANLVTSGSFEDYGAKGVSGDGAVVVGNEGFFVREAFRWTSATGLTGLGYLPFGPQVPDSSAMAVSGDGQVIVGQSVSHSGPQAFRWNSGAGMVGLGDLPGGEFHSIANAVSGDGSMVVGRAASASGTEAFIWDSIHGLRSLRTLLMDLGANDVSGWTLTSATGISSNGRTIVGFGTNPLGNVEGWVAQIPAAVLCYANCDGSTSGTILNVGDFACFVTRFEASDSFANCDGSVLPPVLNVSDFVCFMNRFAAGCN